MSWIKNKKILVQIFLVILFVKNANWRGVSRLWGEVGLDLNPHQAFRWRLYRTLFVVFLPSYGKPREGMDSLHFNHRQDR